MIRAEKYYDHKKLTEDIFALRSQYPMLEVSSAGKSVQGRELWYLTVGRGERTLLAVGTHHAREYVTSILLMKYCEDLLQNYDEALMRRVRVVFLPMLDPDGVEICLYGPRGDVYIESMPRLSGTYSSWKANGRGVDLNRNYPCLWEEKRIAADVPSSEMYNGPHAASEPEVRAMMELSRRLVPALALTFHTKGEEIYYADTHTPSLAEESLRFAEAIAEESGYRILPPSSDPAVFAAGFENWFRDALGRPCLLIEAGRYDGTELFEMGRFDAEIWEKLKSLLRKILIMI